MWLKEKENIETKNSKATTDVHLKIDFEQLAGHMQGSNTFWPFSLPNKTTCINIPSK